LLHYELHGGVELGMNATWWHDAGGVVGVTLSGMAVMACMVRYIGMGRWRHDGGLGMLGHNRCVLLENCSQV